MMKRNNPYAKKKTAYPPISLKPLIHPSESSTTGGSAPEKTTSSTIAVGQPNHGDNNANDNEGLPPSASQPALTGPRDDDPPVSRELPLWKRLPSQTIAPYEILTVTELAHHGAPLLLQKQPERSNTTMIRLLAARVVSKIDDPRRLGFTWIQVADPLVSSWTTKTARADPAGARTVEPPATTTTTTTTTETHQPPTKRRKSSLPPPRPLPSSVTSMRRKSAVSNHNTINVKNTRRLGNSNSDAITTSTAPPSVPSPATTTPSLVWVLLEDAMIAWHNSSPLDIATTDSTKVWMMAGSLERQRLPLDVPPMEEGTIDNQDDKTSHQTNQSARFYLKARIVHSMAGTPLTLQHRALLLRRHFLFQQQPPCPRNGEPPGSFILGCGPPPYPPPLPPP